MAIYYFDVDDNGTSFSDDEGTDCKDMAHVKHEAVTALVEMIKDTLPDGDHHNLAIKVRDQGGTVVLHVALQFDVQVEHRPSNSSPDSHV